MNGPRVAAIAVSDLRKSYGPLEAVKGVSFEVARGRGVRAPGTERRGQDHDRRDPRGLPPARWRVGVGAGHGPGARRRAAARADRDRAAGVPASSSS